MARIAFAGSPNAAAIVLRALVGAGHDVAMVISQPDKPKGRRGTPTPTPVSDAASELGRPLRTPVSINDDAFLDELVALDVMAVCVVGYGQILRQRLLETWPCLNVHFSILPAYRGAAPVERALMDGCTRTGVTIMQMDAGLDTGPMISVGELEVAPTDDAGVVLERLADRGAELLDGAIRALAAGDLVTTPQPGEGVSFAPKIGPDDIALDPATGAQRVINTIRALSPHIGAALTIGGERFKLWAARQSDVAAPAGALHIEGGRVVLPCSDGSVEVLELQPPGRSRMRAEDFARGWRGGLELESSAE